MIPLLLTTAYLFVMSIMVSSDLMDTRVLYSHRDLYLAATEKKEDLKLKECKIIQENCKTYHDPIEQTEAEEKKEEKIDLFFQKPPNLEYDPARPPNNSRINFYELFFSNDRDKFSPFEQTASLLRNLYPNYFSEGSEYQFLNSLLVKKEEVADFLFPDELATLTFDDKSMEELLHKLLEGSKDSPSLLLFITFDKQTTRITKKINFLFAQEEILLSIFPRSLVDSLLQGRALIWNLIEEQQKIDGTLPKDEILTRTKISQMTKNFFKEELEKVNLDAQSLDCFEFTLGKKGSILLTENPLTHLKERKKILKRTEHK